MLYEIGSKGLKRIDVHENEAKNNLPIGTVLHLNGYNNPDYVIVKNLGISKDFSYYGARYERISLDDYSVSVTDAYGMSHISEKKDERIKLYYTDKILTPDEIMDAIKLSELKKINDIKALAIKDQKKAEELDYLKKEYPYLETIKDSKRSSHALGAANIRKELKLKFPKIKFSVTSDSYSGGCSIDISWDDAVLTEEIEKIVNKYEQGSFDGMTDCYNYRNSQFIDLFGGAKYVMTNRHISHESFNKTALKMGYKEAIFNPKTGSFDNVAYEISEIIKRETYQSTF